MNVGVAIGSVVTLAAAVIGVVWRLRARDRGWLRRNLRDVLSPQMRAEIEVERVAVLERRKKFEMELHKAQAETMKNEK